MSQVFGITFIIAGIISFFYGDKVISVNDGPVTKLVSWPASLRTLTTRLIGITLLCVGVWFIFQGSM
jgi:hypothetical protein